MAEPGFEVELTTKLKFEAQLFVGLLNYVKFYIEYKLSPQIWKKLTNIPNL